MKLLKIGNQNKTKDLGNRKVSIRLKSLVH